MPNLNRYFIRILSLSLVCVMGAFLFAQTIPTFSQSAQPTPARSLTPAQASSQITARQNQTIDNALNNIVALPATLFPSCNVKRGDTANTQVAAENKLIKCIRDIINIIFIIAIIAVIVDLASSNLGLILRSGASGGSGDNPVSNARSKIERAIIGLVLIGGITLILNLFASNLLSFSFSSLNNPTVKPFSFNFQPQELNVTKQPAFYTNANNGTKRTDINLDETSALFENTTSTELGKYIDQYFAQKKIVSPISGRKWVLASRQSEQPKAPFAVPLQTLIGYPALVSRWGDPASNSGLFECANQKNSLFLEQMSANTQANDPTIKAKKKNSEQLTPCDTVKKFASWDDSLTSFVNYYSVNMAQQKGCARWEGYNPATANICSDLKRSSDNFLTYMTTQVKK